MFDKVLIANRGEIACRVIQTARRLGIQTVAVYSEADARARHVRLADEAVLVGPAAARDSYLSVARILDAAKRTGATAIHPGYGFLSENEAFCLACEREGIVFIGPPVSAMRVMGSKSEAKKLMATTAVPLTPGYHGDDQDPASLRREADAIGYPVLIKAAAGGGGKGMRLVEAADEFAASLLSCQREAMASFGGDHVLIEKYIVRPRHIEIQVFGDRHGNYVHLFERDCSVQRRHQKVLEEAPAPGMTPERRAAMGHAALEVARAVGYVGAGTVEFIVDPEGSFYFMEMNTRLQVEHPVTEMITGLDLVEWQFRVAAGQPLPLAQEQLAFNGHAIEARIYAEEPSSGFLPSTGRLVHVSPPPESRHVRLDTGVEEGDDITPHYDPMIAKLIVWDDSRARALTRLAATLAEYRIVGVASNLSFLSRLVTCPSFVQAQLDTGLIAREARHLLPANESVPSEVWLVAAVAELLREQRGAAVVATKDTDPLSPWHLADGWRLHARASRELRFGYGEAVQRVGVLYCQDGWCLEIDGRTVRADGSLLAEGRLRAELDGHCRQAAVIEREDERHVFLGVGHWPLRRVDLRHGAGLQDEEAGQLLAPMPGKVVAILAVEGCTVEKAAPLMVLEAMKMEHTITAPSSGRVTGFRFGVGDQVGHGDELLAFEADPPA